MGEVISQGLSCKMRDMIEAELIRDYGVGVSFMMAASYVAVCAERGLGRESKILAGEYWDKADAALTRMGESAFEAGVDLILLRDSETRNTQIFIGWLKGQGWSVLAGPNTEGKFRDLIRSEQGEDVLRVLKESVELPVQIRKEKKLMFQVFDGYVKLTACAAALQLRGLPDEAGEVYREVEQWVRTSEGRKIIGGYGAIPGFRGLGWYKRLVKAAGKSREVVTIRGR